MHATTIMPRVKTHALVMTTTMTPRMSTSITTTTSVTPRMVPSSSLFDVEQQRSKALTIFIISVKDSIVIFIFDVEDPESCCSHLKACMNQKI